MSLGLELLYQALLLADARQSQYALDRPAEYREYNPLVRKYGVKKYFIASAVSHAFITYTIPKKYVPMWQTSTIVVQFTFVAHNAKVGVKIGF